MFTRKNNESEEPASPQVLRKIRDNLDALTGEEKTLAEYVINNYALVPNLSLIQLAESAHVSPGVVRTFCKDIGLDGYHNLHDALDKVDSVAATVFFERVDTFDLEHTVKSVFDNIASVLEQTRDSVDLASIQQAVDAISEAKQIAIVGMGTSASVAEEFAYRLELIGLNCNQYVDPHRQLMSVALLSQQDIAIGVSHSGRTRSVVNVLRMAQQRNIRTMCITDFPHSPITEHADICVTAVHAERSLGVEMVATRAAQLALIDAIVTAVALRNKTQAIQSLTLNEQLLVNVRC
ncbi:MAG: MurR/RpiR family transcriptional regulator [Anaerolineae bacterium]|nr:MurR/RpiR family transcriptional regulator [Anaerolineae bacterium]